MSKGLIDLISILDLEPLEVGRQNLFRLLGIERVPRLDRQVVDADRYIALPVV